MENDQLAKENKLHLHLSTIFVAVGIISFTLGIIVNVLVIKTKIKNGN